MGPVKQKLTETQRLCTALAELMPPNTLGYWLRTPNPAFEGQSPIQILERGEPDRLWHMIFQIDANVVISGLEVEFNKMNLNAE